MSNEHLNRCCDVPGRLQGSALQQFGCHGRQPSVLSPGWDFWPNSNAAVGSRAAFRMLPLTSPPSAGPWICHLNSLQLCFLIWKTMGNWAILVLPASPHCCEGKNHVESSVWPGECYIQHVSLSATRAASDGTGVQLQDSSTSVAPLSSEQILWLPPSGCKGGTPPAERSLLRWSNLKWLSLLSWERKLCHQQNCYELLPPAPGNDALSHRAESSS